MARRLLQFFPADNQDIAFPGSANFDLSHAGKALPAFRAAEIGGSLDLLNNAVFAVHTKAPNGTPRTYFGANKTVYRVEDDAITVDQAFGDVVTDGAIVDDGAGTAILLVVFGGSATIDGNAERDLATDTTPWTTNSGATKMQAWFLQPLGADLAAVSGNAAVDPEFARTGLLGDSNVVLSPNGNDPTLSASYSLPEPVGPPQWIITGIAPFRDRLFVGRPDGAWVRDVVAGRWLNLLESIQEFSVHGQNGKLTAPGENGCWYGTYSGQLWWFDGAGMVDMTPFRELEMPRDTRVGRIEAIADWGDAGIAAVACWDRPVEGPQASDGFGLRVFKETNAAVITELTGVADGSLQTPATNNMGGWGGAGAAGSWSLVFVADVPLDALVVRVPEDPNSAVQSFTDPETMDGAGGWTSLGGIIDSTILSTAAVSLALLSLPPSAGAGVISWTAVDADLLAQLDTYNGVTGYVYRVKNATTTGMSAGTTIAEVGAAPSRAGLPEEDLLLGQNWTRRLHSGAVSRILQFRREGGGLRWSELYTLPSYGNITQIVKHTGPMGSNAANSGPNLLFLGRFQQWLVAESATRDPSQTGYPMLALAGAGVVAPVFAVRPLPRSDPRRLQRLYRVLTRWPFLRPTDSVQLVLQDEQAHLYNCGVATGTPAVWDLEKMDLPAAGRWEAYFVLSLDSALPPAAPYLELGLIDTDDEGVDYEALFQQPGFTVPEGA